MRPKLMEAVQVAIGNTSPPPANETDTCNRVIYPLLLAAGYDYKEIRSQDTDAAKGKPDYTLLPEDEMHMWFLEAKAWHVPLEDSHAQQAINYVNTQGKRWVVLSNGRDWRLYDNHIIGIAEEKLAAQFALKERPFISFLEAISKTSISSGKLEPFVQNQRLYATLATQLSDPKSEVVRAIGKVLKNQPGLSRITNPEVVSFFREANSTPAEQGPPVVREPMKPLPSTSRVAGGGIPLAIVKDEDVTGKRPILLRLSTGVELRADVWKQISVKVAEHCLPVGLADSLPIFFGPKAKSPLLTRSGSLESKFMREPVKVQFRNETFLVETHYSARDHVRLWRTLLSAVGESPEGAELEVAE